MAQLCWPHHSEIASSIPRDATVCGQESNRAQFALFSTKPAELSNDVLLKDEASHDLEDVHASLHLPSVLPSVWN